MKKKMINRLVRWSFLAAFLIFVTIMGQLHSMIKLYPPIDAFCPFGALESAWSFIVSQRFLQRVAWSSFILFFLALGTALVFRRSFCGNICPLGFLQEIFGLAGKKILGRRFEFPRKIDAILRYVKYIVLAVFVFLSWKTFTMVIRPYDPWVAYHHLGSDELLTEYLVGTIILVLTLLGGFFLDRPFCRFLCPMGGFLALPSKIGLSRVKRNSSTCTSCGLCSKACPMAIKVMEKEQVKSAECISCGECVQACPVPSTLEFSLLGKKPLPSLLVPLGTILVFVLVIGFARINNSFSFKRESGLEHRAERLLMGPQKIKGDNTPFDIVQVFGIRPEYFYHEFGLDNEEDFYKSLDELGLDSKDLETRIQDLFERAGMNPRGGGGGGSGGGGSCSDEH